MVGVRAGQLWVLGDFTGTSGRRTRPLAIECAEFVHGALLASLLGAIGSYERGSWHRGAIGRYERGSCILEPVSGTLRAHGARNCL